MGQMLAYEEWQRIKCGSAMDTDGSSQKEICVHNGNMRHKEVFHYAWWALKMSFHETVNSWVAFHDDQSGVNEVSWLDVGSASLMQILPINF